LEPNLPQHDETIVPVRPRLGAGTPPDQPAAPAGIWTRLRDSLGWVGGAALLVAIGAAFFWFPAQRERERAVAAVPAAEAPATESAAPKPVLSPEEEAALREQGEDLLAELLTLQDRLASLNVAVWAAEDWQRYEQLSDDGDNAFLAQDFATAVQSYVDAKSLGEAIIARAATTITDSFAAAEAAFEAGDPTRAIEQYDIVVAIDPTHARALAGRARAERLPEVLALVQRADVDLARGELDAALASYREALAIDSGWAPASAGVGEVNRRVRDSEFDRRMSAGFARLGDEDFNAAKTEFTAALALRPNSQEATDGLAQAEQGAKLNEISLIEVRALAFERRELWEQAIELYSGVLTTDETLLFAQTGLERAEARAGLDAKLKHLIDNPTLLFGDTVLTDARRLVDEAKAVPEAGPRLTEQIAQLGRLVELAATPIPIRLESDQLTNVTLYRVGALGVFASKDVELRPGTYTVVGSRDGYRDVRQTFTVRPGRNLPAISVVCVEPI
jgi:tetratricopeptide (TPR) repeat protein